MYFFLLPPLSAKFRFTNFTLPHQVCCLSHLFFDCLKCSVFLHFPPPLLHSSPYTLFRNPYYRLLTYSHYSMKSISSLPKSFSIDDTSFILLHSLFLLFSHPTVVVSGDPLQDCAHSFTMIWPIWRDLVHCATSVHTLHATPGRCERNTCRRQATNQTIAQVANTKGPQYGVVVVVVVVRQTIKMEWNNRRLSTPATTTTKRERVRNRYKVALNCERLMRQEFHRRQRHKLRQRQSPRQVSDVRCQMSKQWAKV